MNIRCPNCQTLFRVDPTRVPVSGIRARCSRCSETFFVQRDQDSGASARTPAPAPPAAIPTARGAEPLSAPAARSAQEGPASAPAPAARQDWPAAAPAARATQDRPGVGLAAELFASGPPQAGTRAADRPAAGAETARPVAGAAAPSAAAGAAAVAPRPAWGAPAAAPASRPGWEPPAAPTPPAAAAAPSPSAPAAGTAEAPRRPNAFGSRDPDARAKRIARALVSDIIAYHPKRWESSRDASTLRAEFREEIMKSWEEYVAQVGLELAKSTPHFRTALNDILARGQQVF